MEAASVVVVRATLLRQASMRCLTDSTVGDASIRIALIDGAVQCGHPALAGAAIEQGPVSLDHNAGMPHATFIASMLVGFGDSALGLCRGCTLISLPVADADFDDGLLPAPVAANRLAQAVNRAVALRAHIIQLSMQFSAELSGSFKVLADALHAAAARGVRTVIAAGNQMPMGASQILSTAGVVPVATAQADGRPAPGATLGVLIGARGLLAPGVDIPGAALPRGRCIRSGSSYSAAFVTAAFALLRSRFPKLSHDILWNALLAMPHRGRNAAIVPPLLDADRSLTQLTWHERALV